ncbi:MAG: septal ring lytic transglycosylase RlpA family protein [Saprospirales bacterium]|nr:septal ring lytic transglycosylase RlpA family protein [Saprospirales bacterium]
MKKIINLSILFVFSGFSLSMAQAPEYGQAIYYADYFHGKRTASGETYDKYGLTCAHKVHPFGTQLKVTRMDNFKSVIVRVNDRGPYNPGCVVDVSWAAADQIGLLLDGKVEVKVEVAGYSGRVIPQSYSAPNTVASASTPSSASAKGFSLPLPPQPVTFNNAFPETTTYQAAKTPVTSSVPQAYNQSNVPTSYNSFSAPVNPAAPSNSAGVASMPAGQQGYSIQVGSYTFLPNAERQAKMIADKGVQQVYIKESRKPDGTMLYKILVRVFGDRTEASNYVPQLKSKYELAGYVVNLANM